jgi:2-oxoglutarate dehydrogenase E1 component
MDSPFAELMVGTPFSGGNAAYLESAYDQYLKDPQSVAAPLRALFDQLPPASGAEQSSTDIVAAIAARAKLPPAAVALPAGGASEKQAAVSRFLQAFANRGHLIARIDPLGLMQRPHPRVLDLDHVGLSNADLETEFFTGAHNDWIGRRATLREILRRLEQVYGGSIGAEFAHVSDTEERLWLQDEFSLGRMAHRFSADEKREILTQLTAAEGLERYLHTKYVGQKRFSLEGSDALIPLLDDLIQEAGRAGVQEVIVGMAHRGRLNVLVNVMGKSPGELFSEFEGKSAVQHGSGDVKYHKGFSADLRTPGGNVHVALAFNPSHLEIVDPVVEGSVRARQERRNDTVGEKVIPVLIHGDAAFAGQGVVMETLQLSQTRGYRTGGTVHVIINNQVGFTTSELRDARSTMYCSDVAKMIEAPILHVNADDPEAVIFVTRLALRYRLRFHKDMVIDLVGYRRLGHNEADEPAATQPMMYQAIRQHPTVRKLYADRLAAEGIVSAEESAKLGEQYRQALDEGRHQVHPSLGMIGNQYTVDWSRYRDVDWTERPRTGVGAERLARLGLSIVHIPPEFTLQPRVAQIFANRAKMVAGEIPLDWGCAETLAYSALLDEGTPIRISGQDSARGTFFHRQAVLHDQGSDRVYVPLQHIRDGQARIEIIDSILSEAAVLGFEYGYSTTSPDALVIWEAQFGDFVNGAQVLIDQFISSGEAKWERFCGLTLFLPHGYEGQGPEHSSARPERFLQLCAEQNMQLCVPSTPAQMFHMLRRQMLRSLRKPLIVMTPKSLLRHELSVSALSDLVNGSFSPIIDDVDALDQAAVKRIVCCSGKVYFDLLKARRAAARLDVALVRVEQLYPFPSEEYQAVLGRYPNATELIWCQEEPQNQGAWHQIRHRLEELAGPRLPLYYAGRGAMAAPATGSAKLHDSEQQRLVNTALSAASPARDVPRPDSSTTQPAAVKPLRKSS